MKKSILLLVLCLAGCAGKGRIDKVGTITISGYEFSDCNKTGTAAFVFERQGEATICGYTIPELIRLHGASYERMTVYGDSRPSPIRAESLTAVYGTDDGATVDADYWQDAVRRYLEAVETDDAE